jgi:protease II
MESFVCGHNNILEDNSAGGLLVGGTTNTITNSYQGIVCGQNNKVYGAQSPAVFG